MPKSFHFIFLDQRFKIINWKNEITQLYIQQTEIKHTQNQKNQYKVIPNQNKWNAGFRPILYQVWLTRLGQLMNGWNTFATQVRVIELSPITAPGCLRSNTLAKELTKRNLRFFIESFTEFLLWYESGYMTQIRSDDVFIEIDLPIHSKNVVPLY